MKDKTSRENKIEFIAKNEQGHPWSNSRFGGGEYGADIRGFGFAVEKSEQAD
jgi:hypothetical protein